VTDTNCDTMMKLPPKRKVYDFIHQSSVGVLVIATSVMGFSFMKDTVKITFSKFIIFLILFCIHSTKHFTHM